MMKKKYISVLIAIFFGMLTFLYTFKYDKKKFIAYYTVITLLFIMNLFPQIITLIFLGRIYAIFKTISRSKTFYNDYFLNSIHDLKKNSDDYFEDEIILTKSISKKLNKKQNYFEYFTFLKKLLKNKNKYFNFIKNNLTHFLLKIFKQLLSFYKYINKTKSFLLFKEQISILFPKLLNNFKKIPLKKKIYSLLAVIFLVFIFNEYQSWKSTIKYNQRQLQYERYRNREYKRQMDAKELKLREKELEIDKRRQNEKKREDEKARRNHENFMRKAEDALDKYNYGF